MVFMAFCNSCGTTLDPTAKVCPKCGAAQPGGTSTATVPSPTPAAPPASAPAQGSNVLKPVLIALAAIVIIGALAIATIGVIGLHIARRTRVENRDGNVHIVSPFGSVDTSTNPSDVARNLGIEIYPGAELLKGDAANIGVAGMQTVAAKFETPDSPDKVAAFYHSKFPDATYKADGNEYKIISNQNKNLLTIKIEPDDGKTLIKVAKVGGVNITTDSSSD